MPRWAKGQSGNPAGRPTASKAFTTARVRADFIEAFVRIGGVDGLTAWAKKNPGEFYKLLAKLVPKEIEVAGKDGGPVQTRIVVEFVEGANTG